MIDADKVAFVKIVMGFAEIRGKQLSLPAVELYWLAMRDWDLADFQAAAARLLKTCEWMPLPHHFEDLRKSGRMTAGEAFAKAIGWARNGEYQHPAKTPEAILIDRVVASLGGWVALTSHNDETLHFLERRFAENYGLIEDATDTRQALPQITSPGLLADMKRLTELKRIGAK